MPEFATVSIEAQKRRDALTPLTVGRGVLAMHRNGRRLFSDALRLLEGHRYQSAVMLAILAHEEFGKASSMGIFTVVQDPQGLRKLWLNVFESHSQKNSQSIAVGVVTRQLDVDARGPGPRRGGSGRDYGVERRGSVPT